MQALTALAAFSPILMSAIVILRFRRSAAIGAMTGIALAVALIAFLAPFTVDLSRLQVAATSAVILTLSAVLVILPGLYLNAVLRGQGVVEGLASWIQSLRVDAERKALILLLGFLPAVESLTGFGVSLFLSVPIFFRLFPTDKAYRISLLGMNIMPWGTLALATVIAASLTGQSVTQLGATTALTSSLVFPCIGLIALFVLGGGPLLRKHGLLAVLLGLALAACLFVFSRAGLTETAGILAGAVVGLVGFALLRQRRAPGAGDVAGTETAPPPVEVLRLLLPYALVLALILVSRMIEPVRHWLSDAWVLASPRVKFSVFGSPGWALAIVALLLSRLEPVRVDHKAVWSRAKTASAGIFCFVFLAQLMLESDMIQSIATLIEPLGDGHGELLCGLSPLLGAISGFTTGSNLGGNALMVVMQHQVGEVVGQGLLFSAVQNSGAGHAVFASLPIIILVMTIARDSAKASQIAEHDLLRFTLKALCFVFLALVAGCFLVKYAGLTELLVAR